MAETIHQPSAAKRPRRWRAPSLRWMVFMLMAVLVIAAGFRWDATLSQQHVVEEVLRAGGTVTFRVGGSELGYYDRGIHGGYWTSPPPLIPECYLPYINPSLVFPLTRVQTNHTENSDQTLQVLGRCPQVKSISLGGSQITNDGLGHLSNLHHLEILELWSAKLTDEDVDSLKEHRLKSLALTHTQVGDNTLRSLRDMQTLEALNLSETLVSDAGLQHLEGLTNLKHLDLCGCNVTLEGAQQLKKKLPDCRILWRPQNSWRDVHVTLETPSPQDLINIIPTLQTPAMGATGLMGDGGADDTSSRSTSAQFGIGRKE